MYLATGAVLGAHEERAKNVFCDMKRAAAQERRGRASYHVRCLPLIFGCALLLFPWMTACGARASAVTRPVAAMAHVKPRPDLLWESSRQFALFAAYAEREGDFERSWRWWEQALCHDTSSLYLHEQAVRLRTQLGKEQAPRCYQR